MREQVRCEATIYRRDAYRYTGGRHRFRLHYTMSRCSRAAVEDGLCRQHACEASGVEIQVEIADVMGRLRTAALYMRMTTELAFQDAVSDELTHAGVPFLREHVFGPRSRVDFYLPDQRAAVELKVAGGPSDVMRQLYRYAQEPGVDCVVLLTRRARHRSLPREMNGKPVYVLFMWEGAFR